MHAIGINGSPRKDWNTATMLKNALDGAKKAGASTELLHLYDFQYKGCISCFSCKKKGTATGRCGFKDELSPVLEKIMACDLLFLGSPIYIGEVTGAMRSLLERLIFMNINYNKPGQVDTFARVDSAFFFTMNMPQGSSSYYTYIFENNCQSLRNLGGESEYYACYDTSQFDDYSKYEAGKFDAEHKLKIRTEQFPIDCQTAFDIGNRLAAAQSKRRIKGL